LSNEIVSIALSESPQSPILPVAGTEDRALLGSNPRPEILS
jgi:hypothetical protein